MSYQPSNRNQFVWKIQDFSASTQKSQTSYYSPVFHTPNLFQTEWKIKFGINGPEKNNTTSIYVKRCTSASDTGPADLFLQMEICLLDPGQKECFTHYMKCNFKKGFKRGFTCFVDRKVIVECRNFLLQEDVLTVQCCLWKCLLDEIQPVITTFSSKLEVEELSFLWTLGWFREWELGVNRNILMLSDIALNGFELYGILETELTMEGSSRDVLCLNISPMAVNARKILLAGTILILDCFHRSRISVTGQHFFEAGTNAPWQFARILRSELTDPSRHILDFNTLKMNCLFSVADGKRAIRTRECMTPLIEVLRNDEKTLVKDIRSYAIGDTFPDMHFKLGNRMFPAHRIIVGARSPVFHELLRKAECKRKGVPLLPIDDSVSESDNVQQKRNKHFALPLYDSETTDSDSSQKSVVQASGALPSSADFCIIQENVAQIRGHRTFSLDSELDESPNKVPHNRGRRRLSHDDSGSDDGPNKVPQNRGRRRLSHDDSGSDDGPNKVPQNRGHRRLSHDDSGSDDGLNKFNQKSKRCISPHDDSGSDSDVVPKRVGKNKGSRTQPMVCSDSESEPVDNIKPEPDDKEISSESSNESESECVLVETRDKTNAIWTMSISSSESESENVHKGSDKSPTTSPLDASVSQRGGGGDKTESESDDDVTESHTDETPRSSQQDYSALEGDDVPESDKDESSRSSPPDNSTLQYDFTSAPESSDDDVLVRNNDVTISVINDAYVVEISRMSLHTLQQMILCMYTDVVDNMDIENAVEVFRAGVKYQFQFLKDKCESILMSALNMKTVYYLLKTANSVPMLKLKEYVLNFIERNSQAILLSNEWQDFYDTHRELGRSTLQFLRERKYKPL